MDINLSKKAHVAPFLLLIATITEKVLGLITLFMLSRYLTVSNYGKFSFGLYVGFIFAILSDFGFQTTITKELTTDRAQENTILGTALLVRVVLVCLALIFLGCFILIAHLEKSQAILLFNLGAAQIIITSGYLANAVFRSKSRLEIEALTVLIRGSLYFVSVLISIVSQQSITIISQAVLFSSIASTTFSISFCIFLIWPSLPPSFLETGFRQLKQSLPLASAIFLNSILGILAILTLRFRVSDDFLGWYNSAHAVTAQLLFLPEVIMAVQFPKIVTSLKTSLKTTSAIFSETLLIMLALSLPIAIGINLLSAQTLGFAFGNKFLPASTTLKLLSLSLPFYYFNFAAMMLWVAKTKQKNWFAFATLGLFITTLGLKILIPMWDIAGAAVAKTLGEISVFIISTAFICPYLHFKQLLNGFVRITAAALLMTLVVLYTRQFPIFIPVILGAFSYGAMMMVFGPWPLARYLIIYKSR